MVNSFAELVRGLHPLYFVVACSTAIIFAAGLLWLLNRAAVRRVAGNQGFERPRLGRDQVAEQVLLVAGLGVAMVATLAAGLAVVEGGVMSVSLGHVSFGIVAAMATLLICTTAAHTGLELLEKFIHRGNRTGEVEEERTAVVNEVLTRVWNWISSRVLPRCGEEEERRLARERLTTYVQSLLPMPVAVDGSPSVVNDTARDRSSELRLLGWVFALFLVLASCMLAVEVAFIRVGIATSEVGRIHAQKLAEYERALADSREMATWDVDFSYSQATVDASKFEVSEAERASAARLATTTSFWLPLVGLVFSLILAWSFHRFSESAIDVARADYVQETARRGLEHFSEFLAPARARSREASRAASSPGGGNGQAAPQAPTPTAARSQPTPHPAFASNPARTEEVPVPASSAIGAFPAGQVRTDDPGDTGNPRGADGARGDGRVPRIPPPLISVPDPPERRSLR